MRSYPLSGRKSSSTLIKTLSEIGSEIRPLYIPKGDLCHTDTFLFYQPKLHPLAIRIQMDFPMHIDTNTNTNNLFSIKHQYNVYSHLNNIYSVNKS